MFNVQLKENISNRIGYVNCKYHLSVNKKITMYGSQTYAYEYTSLVYKFIQ